MRIALTGATGFIGRYIARHLAGEGHSLRCWYRPGSNRSGFDGVDVQWIEGRLGDAVAARRFVDGCHAVVHSALDRPGTGFMGAEGEVLPFVEVNVLGSIQLIAAARASGVERFVFISTCAVHDRILEDRPLDETHPTWAMSHYGAHKAAIEQFVYSYGLGEDYPICALRPTGVYGVNDPIRRSKWYELVAAVVRGETVRCTRGGKEVHAGDVARGVGLLLKAEGIAGEAYNCYDRYVTEREVAMVARKISGSRSEIVGDPMEPKHQIETQKIRSLGMTFGGADLLQETITQMVEAIAEERSASG
jgi:nucleoside-diphosphate-sugar epimerase